MMNSVAYLENYEDISLIGIIRREDIIYMQKECQIVDRKPQNTHKRPDIPVWERSSISIDEAAEYSGVGRAKLRELTDREDCTFVLWVGSKRLIRRKKLDEYLDRIFSI